MINANSLNSSKIDFTVIVEKRSEKKLQLFEDT